MNKISELLNHIFTARDGVSYSLTKLVGVGASVEMLVKFHQSATPDFAAFGTGIGIIMGALAVKYAVEDKAQ